MIKIFKNSYLITKNNLMTMQPLIIFLLILTFAVVPLKALAQNSVAFWIVFINIMLILIAFSCGWFGMIKQVVINFKNNDKNKEDLKFFKSFFPAVGEYFLPLCLAFILFVILTALLSFGMFKLGTMLFSDVELFVKMFTVSMQPLEQQKLFITSLSHTQLFALNKWIIYFTFWYFLFNILILFFPAIVFFKTKNPFKALFYSVMCVIKKPLQTMGIYFGLMFLCVIISALSLLSDTNVILSLIVLFLTLFFMTYYIVVTFLGYEELFDSNSGSDSNG